MQIIGSSYQAANNHGLLNGSSPLIVHWPDGLKTKRGAITGQPGHLIDFMATFIELAGATYPKEIGDRRMDPLQGRSLSFRKDTRSGSALKENRNKKK